MSKRRMAKRDAVKFYRHLYAVFLGGDGRVEGEVGHIADALRKRGITLWELMGKDPEAIIRDAENEWLRKKLRDQEHVIDGQAQRVFHYDGHDWLHMPLRLWLNTMKPQEPDANLRRDELIAEIGGIIQQINPQVRGLRAKKKGWQTTLKKVKDGAQYEQPGLFAADDEQGAA